MLINTIKHQILPQKGHLVSRKHFLGFISQERERQKQEQRMRKVRSQQALSQMAVSEEPAGVPGSTPPPEGQSDEVEPQVPTTAGSTAGINQGIPPGDILLAMNMAWKCYYP